VSGCAPPHWHKQTSEREVNPASVAVLGAFAIHATRTGVYQLPKGHLHMATYNELSANWISFATLEMCKKKGIAAPWRECK